MKSRLGPTIVGAFVVGGFVILAAALIAFGSGGPFRKPARFVVLLRQASVSGLEPGSPVKFSGVRVGRVETVHARLDPEAGEVVVRVICDIEERTAASLLPPPAPPRDQTMPRLVAGGMSAKVNFSGITGLLYLDLIVMPENKGKVAEADLETGLPIVPIAPSVLAELTETLTNIVNNLGQVDFPGISTEFKKMLATVNGELKDLDLRGTLARVNAAVEAVEKTASDANLREAMQRVNEAASELRGFAAELRAGSPEVIADLRKTLEHATHAMTALAQTADEAKALIGSGGGLGEELGRTLVSLRRSAESINQLVDYLERNPSALLRGRAPDAVSKEGKP